MTTPTHIGTHTHTPARSGRQVGHTDTPHGYSYCLIPLTQSHAHTGPYTHIPLITAQNVRYIFSQQLLELNKCRPAEASCDTLPKKLRHIESPLRVGVWKQSLSEHPDQQFAHYILKGLGEGFRIGFQYKHAHLKQCSSNLVIKDPLVVSEYLDTELCLNYLVKLSDKEAEEIGIHCSPIGIIPKKISQVNGS